MKKKISKNDNFFINNLATSPGFIRISQMTLNGGHVAKNNEVR